ncbi:MAG: hypothetical protein ABFS18_04490 [Thermodesulfobacteriota bacterium]
MYPVRLGVKTAEKRIRALLKNNHHAEALLTAVFTYEKTIHRTLKQLIVSSGFRSKDAEKLLKNIQGFNRQKNIWPCFDPQNRNLPELIDNKHWQHISKAVKMRNDLVHGVRAYNLDLCKEVTEEILALISHTIEQFETQYGFNGWTRITVRIKSKLHSDPKIKT